jgi:multidrug efflux pump
MKEKIKEFFASSWAIDNRTSIYVIAVLTLIAGLASYNSIPKEQFPDIVIPTIFVSTIYPGASPSDMENLVTKHIEKQVKGISGVKKLTSNSIQDFSNVIVEFNTDVDVAEAKRKVKDAVDKAKTDLPNDLPADPNVVEVDFSEMPILYINLSGDFDLNKLKKYADDLKDRIEGLKEITRVDIVGALDREIQINVDMYKMQASQVTMTDISNSIGYENLTVSGGEIRNDGLKRSLSVKGDFTDMDQIRNIVINSMAGSTIYLKDIAEVKDTYKEKESYARLDHKNVITLNIIKRTGENLINASDKTREIIADLQKTSFPKGLNVVLTGDQSDSTRTTLHDLINTIIIGFILVTLILMFFMGTTNAIFVALSVPLSMCIAVLVLPLIGFTLNMIVLFSFLLALGIVVDDAIVVIENTHRIFANGKVPIVTAAKKAAGEVFLPVLSGTLTTLAPFIPLAFWSGIIGKFMFFLPVTLIITLLASLLVAYIMNPVFAVSFMKPHHDENDPEQKAKSNKMIRRTTVVFMILASLSYVSGFFGTGNFLLTILALVWLNKLFLAKITTRFQTKTWPSFQNWYERLISRLLIGYRPVYLLIGTVGLLILSVFFFIVRAPGVVFFPQSDPNFIYAYITLPVGTDQKVTDSITQIVENRVYKTLGENNPLVESVISNVAVGATDPQSGDRSTSSNKGKVSISFVKASERNYVNTRQYLDKIRNAVKGIPLAQITVEQESNGPPVGKPINIEIAGDDYSELTKASEGLRSYLDSLDIPGVEELKTDLVKFKPEIIVDIDRERANRLGISTGQIGMELRNAVYGKEVSKFKDLNDEYPIQLRYQYDQRNKVDQLMNLKITYRDMNMGGMIRSIPLSSFAEVKYENALGGISRKNQKRLVTVYSNVLSDYNANDVVAQVTAAAANYKMPSTVTINLTGEQEEQAATAAFLGGAMLTSLALIFLILVTQFNSVGKPIIILTEIIFSIIGVLLGFATFKMDLSILMTGVGIVALAGIVVRNGILLIEFTDVLRERGYDIVTAAIHAGKIRMTPVLLTASATMLGLIPLAVGMNIDFEKLFTHFNPDIWFGGDSVAFWGPLSWTIIFGLSFATLITLVLVPAMYVLAEKLKLRMRGEKDVPVKPFNEADMETL